MVTQQVRLVLDAVPATFDLLRLGVGSLVQVCPALGDELFQRVFPLRQIFVERLARQKCDFKASHTHNHLTGVQSISLPSPPAATEIPSNGI